VHVIDAPEPGRPDTAVERAPYRPARIGFAVVVGLLSFPWWFLLVSGALAAIPVRAIESFYETLWPMLRWSPFVLGGITGWLTVRVWDPKGRVWPWLVAALSVPVSIYVCCLCGLWLHGTYGATFTDGPSCSYPPIETETCIGRDHSFSQDRFKYARMSGHIDPARCTAFQRAIPSSPVSPLDARGWPRCALDRPETWAEVDCGAAGEADADACYACRGRSRTNDTFYTLVSFSASCAEASVSRGVNVPPRAYRACLDDPRSRSCADASSGAY
jgi:hypothetical protein